MEGGNKKRCQLVTAAVTLAAILAVILWIHGEAVTIKLVNTSRKYIKNDFVVTDEAMHQQLRSKRSNETLAPTEHNHHDSTLNIHSTTSTQHLKYDTAHNASIVVFLNGEMGNHLSNLAKAWSVKLMAEEYGISSDLVLRHQSHRKWIRGRDSVIQCFPKLRHYNFSAANTPAFDNLAREQERLLIEGKWDPARLKLDSVSDNMTTIRDALSYWKRILLEWPKFPRTNMDENVPASFPFLSVASWFLSLDVLDQYLDEIRSFLEFDYNACCNVRPDADESVFVSVVVLRLFAQPAAGSLTQNTMQHLRNFVVEMPKRGKRMGYEELSPEKTATELFAHLNSSDKLAITTRFGGDKVAPYVSALEQRGLKVRVIENQTGTQDFCFLMTAQKEVVGTYLSTFVNWAAYLGEMKRANLYRVMSPQTRSHSDTTFNWTNPKLKDRVFTEMYKSEEQDALEANEQEARMLLFQEWTVI